MPCDPNFPTANTLADAVQMRGQLNALNDRIDAVPAGPPGDPGPPFAQAIVDVVNTLAPGSAATVGVRSRRREEAG